MPRRVLRVADEALAADGSALRSGVEEIQRELGVSPAFPPEVEAAAADAARAPRLPSRDRTDLELVTVDPATSRDLDQALRVARAGDGYVVHYAIADVAAFVAPDAPVDAEAHRRGETLYGADAKIPLHPLVLSEGAGSLLPGQVRPALLWTVELDASGEQASAHVERALVRSRAKLDYAGLQRDLDAGTAPATLTLLRDVGRLRLEREDARGGVSLPIPEQEVEVDEHGRWRLAQRTPRPVELWNAQISLLTGMAAAALMLDAGVGILRTLPPADPRDLDRLRRVAAALGLTWPEGQSYPDFVKSVDPATPAGAAVLTAATRTFRGSGYVAFDGEPPAHAEHAALASPYAHVTAPLRRLADRYAGEVCVAVCAGEPVPEWTRRGLPELPELMREAARRASQYERAILDLVEAAVLAHRVGEVFSGSVVAVDDEHPEHGMVVLPDPAIEAPVTGAGPLPLGERVQVRLVEADVTARRVRFELA